MFLPQCLSLSIAPSLFFFVNTRGSELSLKHISKVHGWFLNGSSKTISRNPNSDKNNPKLGYYGLWTITITSHPGPGPGVPNRTIPSSAGFLRRRARTWAPRFLHLGTKSISGHNWTNIATRFTTTKNTKEQKDCTMIPPPGDRAGQWSQLGTLY